MDYSVTLFLIKRFFKIGRIIMKELNWNYLIIGLGAQNQELLEFKNKFAVVLSCNKYFFTVENENILNIPFC